ncbi:hypothetical protein [Corynebacterium ulcerans]|uniref:hypothetical protein n=1 Tax=Corynebacterium ulcerans TaxID=65058 RepID=UPI000C7571E5|nr:hypothetical protein [Corynebacterium ulcerans]PLW01197.1 hypothetical protein BRL54_11390 [Corynebacterium ulcerans]
MGWVQQDAVGLMLKRLRKFSDSPDRFCAVMPKGWTPAKGPVVVVVSDGTPLSTRGWTRELVRLVVHAHDGPTALRLAQMIDGHLIKPMARSPWAFSLSPATGITPPRKDSRLGGWVTSITYSIALNRKVFS